MNSDLTVALPDEGYLADFIAYGSAVTMAPPEFHLATGLAQVAALAGDRVKFRLGWHAHPLHLWLVLLGPAGAAKKSSAINLATTLLDDVSHGRLRLPTEATREALWALLADPDRNPTGYLVLSEFMQFLSVSRRDYMGGLTEDLCQIFDSPVELRRKLKTEEYVITRPAITILGAAVPDTFAEAIRGKDLAGGFLSRFLFVEQTTPLEYRGMIDDPDVISRANGLKRRLKVVGEVARAGGLVKFPADAKEVWEDYDRRMTFLPDVGLAELSGFVSRAGLYAAKVAVCYALAEGRMEPEPADVLRAVAFVEYCRRRIVAFVDEHMTVTREGRDMGRISSTLRRCGDENGWVTRSELIRRTHLTARRLDELVETLAEADAIEEVSWPTEGRPRKGYRLR